MLKFKALFMLLIFQNFAWAEETSQKALADLLDTHHSSSKDIKAAFDKINLGPLASEDAFRHRKNTEAFVGIDQKMTRLKNKMAKLDIDKSNPKALAQLHSELASYKIDQFAHEGELTPEIKELRNTHNHHIEQLTKVLEPHVGAKSSVEKMIDYHLNGETHEDAHVHTTNTVNKAFDDISMTDINPKERTKNQKALEEFVEKRTKLHKQILQLEEKQTNGKIAYDAKEVKALHKTLESYKLDTTAHEKHEQKKQELRKQLQELERKKSNGTYGPKEAKQEKALHKTIASLESKAQLHPKVATLHELHNAHIEHLQKHLNSHRTLESAVKL